MDVAAPARNAHGSVAERATKERLVICMPDILLRIGKNFIVDHSGIRTISELGKIKGFEVGNCEKN